MLLLRWRFPRVSLRVPFQHEVRFSDGYESCSAPRKSQGAELTLRTARIESFYLVSWEFIQRQLGTIVPALAVDCLSWSAPSQFRIEQHSRQRTIEAYSLHWKIHCLRCFQLCELCRPRLPE